MPTELEELVGFLPSPNPQIRQLALEHLVGYSVPPHNTVFMADGLKPIKHLKVLVNDIAARAKNALTILVNLSESPEVQKSLVEDDKFLELLMKEITNTAYPNADQIAMLLANISQSPAFLKFAMAKRKAPEGFKSELVIDQLMDCFVKGAEGKLNKDANFDYLSYVFANLTSQDSGRRHLVKRQDYDDVIPIEKLVVFTEHKSDVRRKGVASTIKNCCFDVDSHPMLLDPDGVNILPYLLLPMMGGEEYSDEDTEGMPEDLQLLPPDKERDSDNSNIVTHLESILLLTTTREGRDFLRDSKVYPIIRETHLALGENDDVEVACDRVVQVIMRKEASEGEDEVAPEDERAIVEVL